jgi:hypothetical protein
MFQREDWLMAMDSAPEVRPAKTGADRRQILGGAIVLSALAGIPLYAWNLGREESGRVVSDSEKLLLARLSDLVVPATDTPGALAVGVPAFVELALLHGLEGTAPERTGSVKMTGDRGGLPLLEEVGRDLNRHAAKPFLNLRSDQQHSVLAAYDAEAFAPDQKDHPWKKIKALILTGYYTSQVGASRELQYELVPGRYDPDLPLPVNNRSWSSDWTAVDFG